MKEKNVDFYLKWERKDGRDRQNSRKRSANLNHLIDIPAKLSAILWIVLLYPSFDWSLDQTIFPLLEHSFVSLKTMSTFLSKNYCSNFTCFTRLSQIRPFRNTSPFQTLLHKLNASQLFVVMQYICCYTCPWVIWSLVKSILILFNFSH